jgi:hypothetical protein
VVPVSSHGGRHTRCPHAGRPCGLWAIACAGLAGRALGRRP